MYSNLLIGSNNRDNMDRDASQHCYNRDNMYRDASQLCYNRDNMYRDALKHYYQSNFVWTE